MNAEDAARIRGRTKGRLAYPLRLVLILLLPLVFLLSSVPTGYLLEGPGPAFDLQAGLTVEGARTYPSQGEFLLTSVRLQESRLVFHLLSLFDHDFRLLQARDYLGKELDLKRQDRVDEAMTILSRDMAAVLGLRQAGLDVEVRGMGALVVTTLDGYPAYGKIQPGEVIVSVNDVSVDGSSRLSEILNAFPEGQELSLGIKEIRWEALESALGEGEVLRLEEYLSEEVRRVSLTPIRDETLGKRVIGVSTRDFFSFHSPVRVGWELNSVRGPSAGLMMALSLVNALVPEDLTRGLRIAGTGEVDLEGKVGPIGGLPLKVRAAEVKGAEVFLYPRDNQEDLAGVRTSMRLIPVGSLQEAVEVLSSLESVSRAQR